MKTYFGVTIWKAGVNSSGMRWSAINPNGGMFRADTLAGIKELIKEEMTND